MADARTARWAALALLGNAMVWGLSWWPLRALEREGVHPLWATALIYGFGVFCLLAWRPKAWPVLVQQPALWLLAVSSGLTNVGFNWAVTVGDVVRVVLLFYLMPAWAVMLAWPLLGEKPRPMALLRLGLALAGVMLVLKRPDSPWPVPNSLPDYLALLAGLSFAVTNIMLRRLRRVASEARMLAMFGGGTCMAMGIALWGGQQGWVPGLPGPTVTWFVLMLGLAVAFLAGNMALQFGAARLRSATTSLVMLSEILFATLSAVLLGAAVLDTPTLWGGGLIVVAAIWAAWTDSDTAA
jgi:drug/metabolite transporter (DMT)-like permease